MASVIFGDQEEAKTVLDYQPKKLNISVSAQAKDFVISQPQSIGSPFRISELIAKQTGIHELEQASVEKKVELMALAKLQEIQESAYKEAYSLGVEEGHTKGYDEARSEIQALLKTVNDLVDSISKIKSDLLQKHEAQIVDLIFHMSSKLACFEIEKNPNRILPVLRSAFESIQSEETVTVKVSKEDFILLDELKKKSGSENEYLMKTKIEAIDGISAGSCIIETNYGIIDASLKERIEKLWSTLEAAKPNVQQDKFK